MKKTTRRILSLALALVLVCSFAIPVFAADSTMVSWNSGEYLYQMTISLNNTFTSYVPFNDAAYVTWNKGNNVTFNYDTTDTATCYASYNSGLNSYYSYFTQGLSRLGVKLTLTGTSVRVGTFTLTAEDPVGTYTVGLPFTCRSGSATVTQSKTGILNRIAGVPMPISRVPISYSGTPVLIGPY